jgi:hypothetical protein
MIFELIMYDLDNSRKRFSMRAIVVVNVAGQPATVSSRERSAS